jgi:Flp pilus assembly protein CpaB
VVAVSGLLGLWFYGSAVERDGVLMLRNEVARGEPLSRDDLRVAQVGTDDALNALTADQVDEVEGRVVLADLSPGTLLTPDLVAAGRLVAVGDGLVGLALDPGEYPTPALLPGDSVRVVATPGSTGGELSGVDVLVEQAVVVDVLGIGGQDRLFVSLAMRTDQADLVAAAGAEDRVRLIQVGSQP